MTLPVWTNRAAQVWRAWVTDGVPASGIHNVIKSEIRGWGLQVENSLNSLFGNNVGMANGKLVVSVVGDALTIDVKTMAGADPSALDPVFFFFRGAGNTDGDYDTIELTAAHSISISTGSTLGITNINVAFRLWIVVFNDGGTLRLGVINCYSEAAGIGNIYPLDESQVASSVAEGGAGAADGAGIFYTGSAVTAKVFRIIGRATWEVGLPALGLWSLAPDVVALFGPGIKKPGDIVQRVRKADGVTLTGTTTIPLDNTIPQITEGNEFIALAITPKSKANLLRVSSGLVFANSAAVHSIAALFQDAIAGALAAKAVRHTTTNSVTELILRYTMIANTAIATTFRVRIGGESAGTIRFNGASAAQIFGGVANSDLEIEEIQT